MSDIKLFRLTAGKASELQGDASDLEKPLQTLIEANLEPLLGIRFLATEYSTATGSFDRGAVVAGRLCDVPGRRRTAQGVTPVSGIQAPSDLGPLPGIARDVSQQGHWGTGDLELSLTSLADLDTAKPLILLSYQG